MGIKVVERRITRDEVYVADEAFFTGTAAEVTPIREVDNRADRHRQARPDHARSCRRRIWRLVKGESGQLPGVAVATSTADPRSRSGDAERQTLHRVRSPRESRMTAIPTSEPASWSPATSCSTATGSGRPRASRRKRRCRWCASRRTRSRPGGAANVALNVAASARDAQLLGVVGRDEAARLLARELRAAQGHPGRSSSPADQPDHHQAARAVAQPAADPPRLRGVAVASSAPSTAPRCRRSSRRALAARATW